MGQEGGESAVTLIQSTLPSHSHLFSVTAADASAAAVGSNMLPAKPTAPEAFFYAVSPASPNPPLISQTLAIESCGSTGGNQAHPNLMPSQCISFIIYLQGIFPSRN
jgi:microcystin-dependent protein